MNEDRRTQQGGGRQGKPSLPDMAVYTSLYDALGFGPYNLPLVDGNTRYESVKAIFPDFFAHLGIGKPLTAKQFTEGVQSMYDDISELPKRFRELERFMEGIHRRYQLPRLLLIEAVYGIPVTTGFRHIPIACPGFPSRTSICPDS